MDLKAGNPGQRAGRGANLRGKIGEGRKVVARQGRGLSEFCSGELHAVARVPGEADGHSVDLLDALLTQGLCTSLVVDRDTHSIRAPLLRKGPAGATPWHPTPAKRWPGGRFRVTAAGP